MKPETMAPRAVVVNDNPTQLRILAGMARRAGLEAQAYEGAEAALAGMDPRHPPAVVVTDVDMPGIDGWAFCRLLKSKEYAAFNAVPILVGSATFSGEEPERIAADLGVDGFLPLPVSEETFAERVWAILRGERGRTEIRALVVEDSVLLGKLLGKSLAGDGYRTEVDHTLAEAEDAIGRGRYDVAAIDHHLPDGYGDTLLDRLKAEQPGCACIMITGDMDPALALSWTKRGAYAYVRKPFETAYLLELAAKARREQALMRLPKQLEKSTAELRRSEEELRKAELRARTVLESVPEGIVAAERETRRFVFANGEFCRMLGYGREELMGMVPADIHPGGETERVLETFDRMARGETTSAQDLEVRRKDGTTFAADVRCRAAQLDGKDCLLASFVDVTDRRRREDELRQAKETYQSVFDSLTEAIYVQDETGAFIDVNRGAAALYGCSREELIGQNPRTVAAPGKNDIDEIVRRSMDVFRMGEPIRFDFWAVRKNGEIFPKEVIVNRGKYFGRDVLIATARDMTGKMKVEQELRESQDVLLQFMRHSPIYSYVKEVTGTCSRVLMASENFADMVGIPGSKMVGKTMEELFPAEFAAKITADDQAVAAAGKVLKLDEVLDGRHYITIKFPIRRGGKTLLAGYTIDITERELAELELKKRESYLRAMVDNHPGMVWLKDAESRFMAVNAAFAEACGKGKPEAVAGLLDADVWPRELAERYMADDRRTMRGPEAVMVEEPIRDRGETKWYETFKKAVFDEGGKVIGTVGYARDVTERKRAAEQLKRSEERFRSITENAFDMISLLDSEGRYLYCNPSYRTCLGYEPEELLGKAAFDLVHPDNLPAIRKMFAEGVGKAGGTHRFTARLRHKNGSLRWVEHRAKVLPEEGKDGTRVLVLASDVTELKRGEEERERLEGQLVQAQKMESIGRLAGGVAHDFNNMLCAIQGFAEMAMEQLPEEGGPVPELKEIRKAAERSADLTRQLLAFARKQTIAPRVLDLNQTVEGMLKMLGRLIGENIRLEWRPGQEAGRVRMDPSQIDQILANLCVNARDAVGAGGRIAIETGMATVGEADCAGRPGVEPGQYVRLAVLDDGVGMDEETQSHLFEPFFTTKELGQGTGLGLATIYGIVRQNRGYVEVESATGRGTTIAVYLPRHEEAAGDAAPADAAGERGAEGETILLVEDEPAILNMVASLLKRKGYRVLAVESPAEALKAAEGHAGPIDLLMTDMVMPGMNGRQLAERLAEKRPGLKRLFMSGHAADTVFGDNAFGDGAHFIQKPFAIRQVAEKVREALGDDGR